MKDLGAYVQRITIPWLIEALTAIDALGGIVANTPLSLSWYNIYNAKYQLEMLFNASVYSGHLRISRDKSNDLIHRLSPFVDNSKNMEYKLSDFDAWSIKSAYEQLRTILLAEVAALPSYLVTQKENFDIELLITQGVGLFPRDMTEKVPESFNDAMECGRCLAYEVNTACGFHTFRAVEAVLRRYWSVVTGGEGIPVPGTIGFLAGQLKNKSLGDEKVWESLQQMSKLHRNPLAHADVILSREEALGIIGIARSVIAAMLGFIPPASPTAAIPAPLPPV